LAPVCAAHSPAVLFFGADNRFFISRRIYFDVGVFLYRVDVRHLRLFGGFGARTAANLRIYQSEKIVGRSHRRICFCDGVRRRIFLFYRRSYAVAMGGLCGDYQRFRHSGRFLRVATETRRQCQRFRQNTPTTRRNFRPFRQRHLRNSFCFTIFANYFVVTFYSYELQVTSYKKLDLFRFIRRFYYENSQGR